MAKTGVRPGRAPGTEHGNRQAILDAARREFGAHGFQGATLRSIAKAAGVDVALVAHYYRNKDGLFAATLELPAVAGGLLAAALSASPETQGEALTRAYLGLWEDGATGQQMQALLRSALNNDVALARVRELLLGATLRLEVAPLVEPRRTGFSLAISHLLGIAFARYLGKIAGVADLDFEDLVARVSPAVQLHLSTLDG